MEKKEQTSFFAFIQQDAFKRFVTTNRASYLF